eukprot:581468-Amphidinium_carterae.1
MDGQTTWLDSSLSGTTTFPDKSSKMISAVSDITATSKAVSPCSLGISGSARADRIDIGAQADRELNTWPSMSATSIALSSTVSGVIHAYFRSTRGSSQSAPCVQRGGAHDLNSANHSSDMGLSVSRNPFCAAIIAAEKPSCVFRFGSHFGLVSKVRMTLPRATHRNLGTLCRQDSKQRLRMPFTSRPM